MKKLTLLFCFSIAFLFSQIFAQEAAKPIYQITTTRAGAPLGSFTIELFPLIAPKAVAYFDSLVTIKFFDTTAFHRVVPGFVIQGGDPNSRHGDRSTWGNGDPSQKNVPAEFSNVSFLRGILGAARDVDTNSANSQFFICVAPATFLNRQYTAYGRVVGSMAVVDTIVNAPRDTYDNPLQKIEMFVTKIGTNDSIPGTPNLLTPADSFQRAGTSQALGWSSVSGAILYRLDIATDPAFASLFFSDDVPGASFTATGLQLGFKKYYWRVRPNNGGHRGAYSSVRTFTTAIAVPELISPPHLSVNQSSNPTLSWNAVSSAVSYHLQVSTNSLFTVTGIIGDYTGLTGTSKQITGLLPLKKYYWHVAAAAPDYEGAYSATWNFYTADVSSVRSSGEPVREFFLAQNFPNPFNPATEIEYQIPQKSFVTIKIYDLLGKEITSLVERELSPGYYTARWNASNVVSGMYFYRMTAGAYTSSRKMMVIQ